MASFADVQYCIYADIHTSKWVGEWVGHKKYQNYANVIYGSPNSKQAQQDPFLWISWDANTQLVFRALKQGKKSL